MKRQVGRAPGPAPGKFLQGRTQVCDPSGRTRGSALRPALELWRFAHMHPQNCVIFATSPPWANALEKNRPDCLGAVERDLRRCSILRKNLV